MANLIESESIVDLAARYATVRSFTRKICDPLEAEDYVIQSIPDVSPTRWHLAHTTWFFETFVLEGHCPGYSPFNAEFKFLFNSYYNTVGEQFPRSQRGLLSRPTVKEIWAYREAVDQAMCRLLESDILSPEVERIVLLGLQHEQQHQELMLTDIKHVFSCNPMWPAYRPQDSDPSVSTADGQASVATWIDVSGGVHHAGFAGGDFCFDNERPQHRVFLEDFQIQNRLVTSGEYLEFLQDDGYQRPEYWLSAGWAQVAAERWRAPLYWIQDGDEWHEFTLRGLQPLDLARPVCHVSYFEADAFARWKGARLPTEFEWEQAMRNEPVEGNLAYAEEFRPAPAGDRPGMQQSFGDVWEWTASPYAAYPGYRPPAGALGEYNGKFMCNQYILRGGSCATADDHIRVTYRNFFPPEARWQFSGLRLAQ